MAATAPPMPEGAGQVGRYRWAIVGLLFAATVINYIDRQMLGVLKPLLSEDMGWSERDYANIVICFQLAYAFGYISFGSVVDRIGARAGYGVAFVIWQLAHMAHGAASGVVQFAMARFALGVGESGNFPACIKAISEWFPARERAFAIGIFNAGANVGAIVTPLLVPWLVLQFGWRGAFVLTGAAAFVWLIFWLRMYRPPQQHPKVSTAERAWIEQDPPDPATKIPWRRIVRVRETWAYALGRFCIDPVWWFFLFWLPGYLGDRYGLDLRSFGPPLVAIYLLSDVGSVAGGWLSSRLIRAGRSVNFARKFTLFLCALCVVPVAFAQSIDNLWVAVLVIGLATAGHQAFSANLFTLPSDTFPRSAVGSVVGIGGLFGALGGMAMSTYAGEVLERLGSYAPIFAVAGGAYFVGLLVIHLLSPRLEKARIPADS